VVARLSQPAPRRGVFAAGGFVETLACAKTRTLADGREPSSHYQLCAAQRLDDKTFGEGFDCFAENAVCNLGVADWHGRGVIRQNLRDFIDKGFTPHHDIGELWDSPLLKVFHGKVKMTFDNLGMATVRSTMTHFFYMDQADPSK
jgi:hypothetical protein